MSTKIHVIGIGDDGLEAVTVGVRQTIADAEVLLGTDRTLALVPKSKAERHLISGDLNQLVATIEKAGNKRVVLLIYGDPMFYGLARYVCDRLGKDRFVVVPHVSSMQLAFARVMESWEEAYLTDLAKHPVDSVLEKIRTAQKVGLFTTDHCGPAEIARRCWIGTSTTSRRTFARTWGPAMSALRVGRWPKSRSSDSMR